MAYDHLYVEFVYYFNVKRDYFECHEVLEELWLQQNHSPLYQGLPQIAVGLYHYRNGNASGATKLFTGALDKLKGQEEVTEGIRLGKLAQESAIYLEKLKNWQEQAFDYYDLTIEVVDPVLQDEVARLIQEPPRKLGEED